LESWELRDCHCLHIPENESNDQRLHHRRNLTGCVITKYIEYIEHHHQPRFTTTKFDYQSRISIHYQLSNNIYLTHHTIAKNLPISTIEHNHTSSSIATVKYHLLDTSYMQHTDHTSIYRSHINQPNNYNCDSTIARNHLLQHTFQRFRNLHSLIIPSTRIIITF
jgi:hypothetical protein